MAKNEYPRLLCHKKYNSTIGISCMKPNSAIIDPTGNPVKQNDQLDQIIKNIFLFQ